MHVAESVLKERARQHRYRMANLEKVRARERRYRTTNAEKVREKFRRWYAENAEYYRLWRAENPEKAQEAQHRYRVKNPSKIKAAQQRYRVKHAGRVNAKNAKRVALRRGAAVGLTLVEQAQIQAFYVTAQRLTTETGVAHHVDHIVPLSCGGPHHPSNLQVLTATENLRKAAKAPAEWLYDRGGR